MRVNASTKCPCMRYVGRRAIERLSAMGYTEVKVNVSNGTVPSKFH